MRALGYLPGTVQPSGFYPLVAIACANSDGIPASSPGRRVVVNSWSCGVTNFRSSAGSAPVLNASSQLALA